ncbi:hypothetical protein PR001_g27859 [Phytophthora rubi]|uniref:Uncharacterized protein n=1 Tax=Phytophthora rubi TaxID=129364 RepID=A0A6A3HGW2_9STRA|nr:hypothetical protein PR001_g27859 [Phytophthora rubi]
MTSDNGDADRGVGDMPPHTPEQPPDAPSLGGGASGSGSAGGDGANPPGTPEEVPAPHVDPDDSAEEPAHTENPPHDAGAPSAGAEQEKRTEGVDLSTIDDPTATAAAFASVGQLLVTQQIISAATAKHIFQGELNLVKIKSTATAAAAPFLPGDVPPARFGVQQDPSSFVVGVPANHLDRLSERFMRDGYGGLEALTFVETLSDEDIQDLSEMTGSRLSIRPELLMPRSDDASTTTSDFRDLLGSLGARRELASLLQHYPVEGLARKVFKLSSLLKRTLEQLREVKRQLRSNGSRDGTELLEKLTEISNMKTGFALLNQHWKEAFITSKRQLDQEVTDHARDFKHAAQIHEREEEALRSRLAVANQERDDVFA